MIITSKDVFLFANHCIKIQRENITNFKKWIKDPKLPRSKKKELRVEIKRAEEKIDYLENTKSIVIALYQKQNKTLKITEEDRLNFKEKYKLGDDD